MHSHPSCASGLKGLLQNRRGNVAIITAIALPVLVAFVGMVGEYGWGLMLKSEDQRVADLAAYSGRPGLQLDPNHDVALQSAANSAAALNGLSASQLTASLVNSPSGDGNPAVLVTVSTVQPLLLTQLVSPASSFTVTATAYAEINGKAACILALSQSGTGVTLSGGTSVQAPGCAVASNSTITVPCGDHDHDPRGQLQLRQPAEPRLRRHRGAERGLRQHQQGLYEQPVRQQRRGAGGGLSSLSTASNQSSPAGPSVSERDGVALGVVADQFQQPQHGGRRQL